MMNFTQHPSQEQIDAIFFTASELNEDVYVGDIYVDDEGKAMTTVITPEQKAEAKLLDVELQNKFRELILSSASKVEAVMKLKGKEQAQESEVEEEVEEDA